MDDTYSQRKDGMSQILGILLSLLDSQLRALLHVAELPLRKNVELTVHFTSLKCDIHSLQYVPIRAKACDSVISEEHVRYQSNLICCST